MALTITKAAIPGLEDPEFIGRYKVTTNEWTLGSTYVTGGHPYTASDLDIPTTLHLVEVEFPDGAFRNGTAAIVPFWDRANGKIMFFWGDNPNVAAAALIEVTNATSLASYVGRVRVRHTG